MKFKEACKKADITEETARRMVAIDHEFNVLYSDKDRKKLVTIELEDLPYDTYKRIMHISKTLKVSWDAAVNAIIMNYLEHVEKHPETHG